MKLKGFESFISCTVHFWYKKYLSWDFVVGGCKHNVICSDLFGFFYSAVILCFLIILMDFIVLVDYR